MFIDRVSIDSEVQCVPREKLDLADDALSFVQEAFGRLDHVLNDLSRDKRLAFKSVLARHLTRVLANVHFCAAAAAVQMRGTTASNTDLRDKLAEYVLDVADNWKELTEFYKGRI